MRCIEAFGEATRLNGSIMVEARYIFISKNAAAFTFEVFPRNHTAIEGRTERSHGLVR